MKILVLDDDKITQIILENSLKGKGYDVKVVSNGIEGQDIVGSWNPDVVISDILMPHYNGIELLSYVRNTLKKDTPFIMISVLGQKENIDKAFQIGATDYIVKPIDTKELFQKIEKHTLHTSFNNEV